MSEIAPTYTVIATSWLATDPPRPCPDVLTDEEAVIYLRLRGPRKSMRQAMESLGRYRREGRLRAVRMGQGFVYRKADCDAFLEAQTQV